MTTIKREYELTYISRPDVQPADKAALEERLKSVLDTQFEGTLHRVDDWGRRSLAFEMDRQRYGIYTYFRFASRPDAIAELERILRLNDTVLKFLSVKLEKGVDSGKRPDESSADYSDLDGDEEE
jgi:small subunit ribosomal protein S6